MNGVEDEDGIVLRTARPGDGQALHDVTRLSVQGLAKTHYSADQLADWMGARTGQYYEDIIARGLTVVAEEDGEILGFVDAQPGEVTRLFLLPQAAGRGLGKRLLQIGVENAALGWAGPIRIESTLNAQGFYERHGFKVVRRGHFSHGVGGAPIDIVYMKLAQQ